MSRLQDSVVDDEESETCPLCIEELDISDRNFRPCPCGYQICQFCYNNIKTTMNGLCPACRRVYDDKNIKWQVPTAEELATYKESVAQQAKKKAQARQKEAQRREADSLSRKHLAGIRVRQKNLVYVTGMKPQGSPERLAEELRKPEFFGQYGEIVKVVVSKAKENHIGIYVTFRDKDAAAMCIQSVDGSENNGCRLRAQYGTTKYCSAYLRGETCQNRSCMFLHEPGEENESFTRQDLSSMNVISTQSPSASGSQGQHSQPPAQQGAQPIAAASQAMDREAAASSNGSSDGSALPSTANWAKNVPTSRRASHAQSSASPLAQHVAPAVEESNPPQEEDSPIEEKPADKDAKPAPRLPKQPSLLSMLKLEMSEDFSLEFDVSAIDQNLVQKFNFLPSLIDANGGARLLLAEKQQDSRRYQAMVKHIDEGALPIDTDEILAGGSHQLGGEPEERPESRMDTFRRQHGGDLDSPALSMNHTLSPALSTHAGANNRALQQQQLLHQLKSASPNYLNQGPGGPSQGSQMGHARQSSRFSFANDTSASASVKPVTNPKLLNQQTAMMPPQGTHYGANAGFFSGGNNVQGPPPGLKASGTPPVSGGGMFGQGHGFATAGLYNRNEELMRELIRNRGGSAGSGQTSDPGRLSGAIPASLVAQIFQDDVHASPALRSMSRSSHHLSDTRRSTPAVPPGLENSFRRMPIQEADRADFPDMAELGKISDKEPEVNEEKPSKTTEPLVENTRPRTSASSAPPKAPLPIAHNDSAVTPANDESAFPALPKVGTAPVTAPKARTSREKRREKKKKQTLDESKPIEAVAETPSDVPTDGEVTSAAAKPANEKTEPASEAVTSVRHAAPADKPRPEPGKRQHPGKLDISAATAASEQAPIHPSTVEVKGGATSSATPMSSRPGTPGVETPLKRATAPRTLRVVSTPTPKTETPPVSSSPAPVAAIKAQHSAQPSIASPSIPGTPVGDRFRDDLSITTGTMSRAGSPPAGASRVGSAPLRAKTKNQMKKDRQERAKQIEEDKIAVAQDTAAPTEGVVQEPIMGRKKKQKKEKPVRPAKPVKPNPVETPKGEAEDEGEEEEEEVEEEKPKEEARMPVMEEAKPAPAPPEVPKPAEDAPPRPSPVSASSPDHAESSEAAKRALLADLIQALESAGETPSSAIQDFFKPTTALLHARSSESHDVPSSLSEPPIPPQSPLTPGELADLDSGKPVRRGDKVPARLLITPHTRKALKCLTPQLEERFLDLEKSLKHTQPGLRYSHKARNEAAKAAAGIVDEMLRDVAAQLSRPAASKAFHAKATGTTPQGRATPDKSKHPHYADDALAYLNQFILPVAIPATSSRAGIGAAIPRTYTTGDPTYSVSGVDVNPSHYAAAGPATYTYPPTTTSVPSSTAFGPSTYNPTSYNAAYANTAIAAAAAMASSSELPAAAAEAADKLAQNLALGRSMGIDALEGNEGLKQTLEGLAGALSGALGSLGAGGLFAKPGQGPPNQSSYAGHGREMDVETVLAGCRREAEALEKKLMGLVKRNRRAAGLS